MRTLILEPHFDDTAYSLAGLILSGIIDADALIVTVFSRSMFAPYADASGIDQISVLRYGEHKKFCAQISFTHSVLGYEEAPQRGWPNDMIFDNRYGSRDRENYEMQECGNDWKNGDIKGNRNDQDLGGDGEMVLRNQLTGDFSDLNKRFMPDAVFTPLGICGHIDHLLVRECAERVFPEKLNFYEDLPYAGEIQTAEYTNWINQLTSGLYPIQNPGLSTLGRRIELLNYYPSQVAEKDIASVRNYVTMHQGERFWSKTNIHE